MQSWTDYWPSDHNADRNHSRCLPLPGIVLYVLISLLHKTLTGFREEVATLLSTLPLTVFHGKNLLMSLNSENH